MSELPTWVPQACTLPTAERPLRRAEFDDLFTRSVRAVERSRPGRLRLSLSGPADLEAAVTDLAARESECCSFFQFTVTSPGPGEVVLDVEVDDAHIDVVAALAERAQRLAAHR